MQFFSPHPSQVIGLVLYFTAAFLALLAVARSQWVVRQRERLGVTFMSITLVGAIGAAVGMVIAIALYLLVPYLFIEPPDKTKERQERVTFLLEATKPLKQASLIIDLRQPLTPDALGHFRALVTVSNMDVSAQYPNAVNHDNPHPTLCVGGRDHYPVLHSGGKQQKLFGVQQLVYALNPSDEMQNTLFSKSQLASSRIELSGGLYGKGPFKTISDLDDRYVQVYVTELLLKHIAAIHFVVNNYVLFSEPSVALVRMQGSPLVRWPAPLNANEEAIPWVTLMLKGTDYPRYEKEGESPDWFPSNLYRPWMLSFDKYTPRRVG